MSWNKCQCFWSYSTFLLEFQHTMKQIQSVPLQWRYPRHSLTCIYSYIKFFCPKVWGCWVISFGVFFNSSRLTRLERLKNVVWMNCRVKYLKINSIIPVFYDFLVVFTSCFSLYLLPPWWNLIFILYILACRNDWIVDAFKKMRLLIVKLLVFFHSSFHKQLSQLIN